MLPRHGAAPRQRGGFPLPGAPPQPPVRLPLPFVFRRPSALRWPCGFPRQDGLRWPFFLPRPNGFLPLIWPPPAPLPYARRFAPFHAWQDPVRRRRTGSAQRRVLCRFPQRGAAPRTACPCQYRRSPWTRNGCFSYWRLKYRPRRVPPGRFGAAAPQQQRRLPVLPFGARLRPTCPLPPWRVPPPVFAFLPPCARLPPFWLPYAPPLPAVSALFLTRAFPRQPRPSAARRFADHPWRRLSRCPRSHSHIPR